MVFTPVNLANLTAGKVASTNSVNRAYDAIRGLQPALMTGQVVESRWIYLPRLEIVSAAGYGQYNGWECAEATAAVDPAAALTAAGLAGAHVREVLILNLAEQDSATNDLMEEPDRIKYVRGWPTDRIATDGRPVYEIFAIDVVDCE